MQNYDIGRTGEGERESAEVKPVRESLSSVPSWGTGGGRRHPVRKTLAVHVLVGVLHFSTFQKILPSHPLASAAESPPRAASFQNFAVLQQHYREQHEHISTPFGGDK